MKRSFIIMCLLSIPGFMPCSMMAVDTESTAPSESNTLAPASPTFFKNPDLYPVFALAATPALIATMRLIGHTTEQWGLGTTMLIGQTITAGLYYYYRKNFAPATVQPAQATTQLGYIILQGKIDETEPFHAALNECVRSPNIGGIIIKIDAREGDIGACQAIFHEIKKANLIKPVIALIEKQCCREAYLVATAAQAIIANEQATIGMIGTTVTITEHKEAAHQESLYFYAGKLTPLGTPLHHITAEEQQAIIHKLEKSYDQLCRNIAQQRQLNLAKSDEWAEGRPFSGTEALQVQLIDHIGTLSDAYDVMARLLKERNIKHGTFNRVPYALAPGERP